MSSTPAAADTAETDQADLKPVKAEPGTGPGLITITVTSQTFADVYFAIKPRVKLRRVMDLYCGKHSLDPKTVKFIDDDGRFVRSEQTPEEVGLQDGSTISLAIDQQGGACICEN
uniref:Ubiquitin-like domain-containing protein n=3 Tax=Oryza TaxID=4527 RepID=A0A0D3EWB9_9ORYZ